MPDGMRTTKTFSGVTLMGTSIITRYTYQMFDGDVMISSQDASLVTFLGQPEAKLVEGVLELRGAFREDSVLQVTVRNPLPMHGDDVPTEVTVNAIFDRPMRFYEVPGAFQFPPFIEWTNISSDEERGEVTKMGLIHVTYDDQGNPTTTDVPIIRVDQADLHPCEVPAEAKELVLAMAAELTD